MPVRRWYEGLRRRFEDSSRAGTTFTTRRGNLTARDRSLTEGNVNLTRRFHIASRRSNRALRLLVPEEEPYVDLDRVERLRPHVPLPSLRRNRDDVTVARPAIHRQRLVLRVDDPVMGHLARAES